MPKSKTDKTRKKKVEDFKEKTQEKNEQQAIPKTHLIPITNWESTEVLDLRGDLLEAFEKQMVLMYQHLSQAQLEFNKAAQILQMIMSANVKAGKIKLTYQWNNGEPASEEDVANFTAKMQEIQQLRLKQTENLKKKSNAEKTGLVSPDGEAIGTTQNLDETKDDDDENQDQSDD